MKEKEKKSLRAGKKKQGNEKGNQEEKMEMKKNKNV